MRFKPLKLGKSKGEPEEEFLEVDKETANQLTEMNENISNRTKNLEETTQQLQDLSETLSDSIDEDDTPKPHGPLVELTVEPEDKMMDIDLDMTSDEELFEAATEEIKVVEVGAEATAPAESNEVGESQPEVKVAPDAEVSEDDSFKNLFGSEEEEVNPLATLINSLPDVSAQELVDDLQEIKDIIMDNKKRR
jgi:hypothetical protein